MTSMVAMTSMLAMSFGQRAMMVALFLVCVLLILVVLVQKGRGGGLAGAFGGGGGASSAFGSKTGDVFTGITVALAAVYLLLTVFGNYVLLPTINQPVSANVAPAGSGPVSLPPTDTTTPPSPARPDATPADNTGGAAPSNDGAPAVPPTAPPMEKEPAASGSAAEGDSGDES